MKTLIIRTIHYFQILQSDTFKYSPLYETKLLQIHMVLNYMVGAASPLIVFILFLRDNLMYNLECKLTSDHTLGMILNAELVKRKKGNNNINPSYVYDHVVEPTTSGAGVVNIQRMSFDDQIQNFNKTREVIKAKIGAEAAAKLCSEAIYFIGLGSNDYVNNYLQPFLADSQQYTYDEFVELLIGTLEGQLKRLYQLGARKMVFHGLGPLGRIPSQRVKSKTGQCLKRVNEWVVEFNSKVQKLIASLNRQLPQAKLSFADTYGDVYDLIQNPTAYGNQTRLFNCRFKFD
ncbi:GDSL esterase/lipase [Pyrus ussuriensis x Pyrus communis]|uniref:GDSL esterase/lipase n=1 Tax=Pyrus ussuriensis x Pyrus communis TaxID=2448454 RepID=A0A5N5GEU6_9ROSA|nr:GDSL esterase/lipase [Pyrus ussuriensis x Pyrus communis]